MQYALEGGGGGRSNTASPLTALRSPGFTESYKELNSSRCERQGECKCGVFQHASRHTSTV